jgi:hypothetical protein
MTLRDIVEYVDEKISPLIDLIITLLKKIETLPEDVPAWFNDLLEKVDKGSLLDLTIGQAVLFALYCMVLFFIATLLFALVGLCFKYLKNKLVHLIK